MRCCVGSGDDSVRGVPEVGARKGAGIWIAVIVVFVACNLASGLLHGALVPQDFAWHFSWSMLALLLVAMFRA